MRTLTSFALTNYLILKQRVQRIADLSVQFDENNKVPKNDGKTNESHRSSSRPIDVLVLSP